MYKDVCSLFSIRHIKHLKDLYLTQLYILALDSNITLHWLTSYQHNCNWAST